MEIRFRNRKLRGLCEIRMRAERRLGPDSARKLRSRLSDLEAAACVAELHAGRPHVLTGARKDQLALDLAGGLRMVLSADQEPCPRYAHGGVDWSRVTAICIESIENYHD